MFGKLSCLLWTTATSFIWGLAVSARQQPLSVDDSSRADDGIDRFLMTTPAYAHGGGYFPSPTRHAHGSKRFHSARADGDIRFHRRTCRR